MADYASMTPDELDAEIERLETELGAIAQERKAAHQRALALNSQRDEAKKLVNLAQLRAKHPELKIEPA